MQDINELQEAFDRQEAERVRQGHNDNQDSKRDRQTESESAVGVNTTAAMRTGANSHGGPLPLG